MNDKVPYSFDIPSVSELTEQIKQVLEPGFSDILVEGELSNVKQSRNGHYYFTVKDDEAQLPCVMWRGTAMRHGSELLDGQQVVLGGNIQVYPPHGKYQLIVSHAEQAGKGKLQQAFEELKDKLQKEGLFDEKNKKELPAFPVTIGVVTSSTGAAFEDIRSTLERRWPLVRVRLYHASVQGVNAAPELVRGINYFCKDKRADLLIIGRGGGSLEDLWPFNEEAVARAIHNCPIPVISAVGHEVDYSISDFVADKRAATPTQAAEMATPDIREIRLRVDELADKTADKTERLLRQHSETVKRLGGAHALLAVKDRIQNRSERVRSLGEYMLHNFRRMASEQKEILKDFRQHTSLIVGEIVYRKKEHLQTLRHRTAIRAEKLITRPGEKLTSVVHRLEKQDPNGPLKKGFARVWQQDRWIRKASRFQRTEPAKLEWEDASIKLGDNPSE